jgi:hypothetical protein
MEASAAPPTADLADEINLPSGEAADTYLLPQGTGLQRLLLDGLGIARVMATRNGPVWHLSIDGGALVEIRSDM